MGIIASKCSADEGGAPSEAPPRHLKRFTDPWWRQFDTPQAGFRDSSGFVNRLPLRLESTELIVYGFVNAKEMWAEYDDEEFTPILVGGRAVVSVWFNNFLDTDCGGAYLETWYNTFVTRKSEPVELPADKGPLGVLEVPAMQSFLMRVLCGDAPGNPGAASKAVHGGREIFGFPKHPDLATIKHAYRLDAAGEREGLDFECRHHDALAVRLSCVLPERAPSAGPFPLTLPVDVPITAPDACIGAPRLGGTHKGMNGAHQSFYATSMKCTQVIAPWDATADSLEIGSNAHYAPLASWSFVPALKVHSPDFKICAHKPSGWISGEAAAAAVYEHEMKLDASVKGGAL